MKPDSIKLIRQAVSYHIGLHSNEYKECCTVALHSEKMCPSFKLLPRQRPEFYSTIRNAGSGVWSADFNHRNIEIRAKASGLSVIDIETGALVDDNELRSVKSLLDWHVKSRRSVSTVPRLWTTR